MSFNPLRQDLSSLERAIVSLDQLHRRVTPDDFLAAQDNVIRFGLQAGLIQNFEITDELCWKSIKRWLGNNTNPI